MRAIEIRSPGGPEALTAVDRPDPTPGPGEVIIDVVGAGINRADVMQRRGKYPPPDGASDLPGLEVSGRIAAIGDDVVGFEVGEPVCALLAGGGYASKVLVPAGQVLPVSESIDLLDAAGLPETAATVYSNLYMYADLQPGQTLLVHGGAGGIGTMAIQMAVALGSTVYVTASSQAKIDAALALGATAGIDYTSEDFVERIKELTDGNGVNVILDVVGGSYLGRNLEALAVGGRIVVIAVQGGAKGELNLAQLMGKRASIIGTTLRARPVEEKTAIMRAVQEKVWPLVTGGRIRVLVDRTFALEDAAAAHEYFDSGAHIGKVLLTIGDQAS